MQPLPRVVSHPWHAHDHHDPGGGFRNVDQAGAEGSLLKGMAWFLQQSFAGKENRLPPVRHLDPEALRMTSHSPRLTWLGHSTVLVQAGALTMLIDPMFGERASPVPFAGPKRQPAFALSLEELPPIDVVVLSHDHYDHLDRRTLKQLIGKHDPIIFAPLGAADYPRSWGSRRVLEMDWWQAAQLGDTRFHCLPATHFSGRSLLDRDETLWASWYVEGITGEVDLYYAGDTGYGGHFELIRERIGRPDVALLPIGAYRPAWLMQPIHVNPEEALRAFRDLEAGHFIPVHWGTFDLAEEELHAPADALRRLVRIEDLEGRVHVLEIGESWVLPEAP